eukprot:4606280-Pleurochrysis_carterae.AAC.1
MSAACKGGYCLAENCFDSNEAAFVSATKKKEYQDDMQASLVDAYGDMRYEKLMPGKHVDYVKGLFDETLLRIRGELVRSLSTYDITDKSGQKVDLDKVIHPILDVHRGIASAHCEGTARKKRLGNALLEP